MPYRQREKGHKLWFEIIYYGTPKFSYKFKEITSLILPYVELIMEQQQQSLPSKFSERLASPCRSKF